MLIALGSAVILYYLMPYSFPRIGISPSTIPAVVAFVLLLISGRWRITSVASKIVLLILAALFFSDTFAPTAGDLSVLRAWIISLILFWAIAESRTGFRAKTADVVVSVLTVIWSLFAIAQAFFGKLAYVSGWFGVTPNIVYATGLSNFSNSAGAMLIPLLMWNLVFNVKRPAFNRTLIWIAGCAALYYTMSRASLLGWIVGVLVVATKLALESNKSELRALIQQFSIALITFYTAWVLPSQLDTFEPYGSHAAGRWVLAEGQKYNLNSFIKSVDDYSRNTRLVTLKVAIKAITKHPVTGIGVGRFKQFYGQNAWQFERGLRLDPREQMSPHNGYLQLAAENGLPALVVILGCAGLIVIRLVRTRSQLATVVLASIGALATWLLFHDGLHDRLVWVLLGLGVVATQQPKKNTRT